MNITSAFRGVRHSGLAAAALFALAGCAAHNSTRVVTQSEERKALDARTREEVTSGKCSPEHQSELQDALDRLNKSFTEPSEFAGFKAEGAQFVVAKEEGATVALDAGLGGEYHVFAFGYSPLALLAEDEQGAVVGQPSNRAHVAGILGTVPPSVEIAHARGSYLITVTGRGCALVTTYKRIY